MFLMSQGPDYLVQVPYLVSYKDFYKEKYLYLVVVVQPQRLLIHQSLNQCLNSFLI